ncbi:MAG: hypothetical protein OEW21_08945 [Betaproteobacteria bacterium]|nr:hypothetical protein [Betaproteobacteria bacterium]
MKRTLLLVSSLLCWAATGAQAAEVKFPADWAKWTSVSTPLTQIGALPDCKADVKSLPPIYQKTVETYCGVRAGGPGKVAVLVNPAALKSFAARDGKMPDGVNMVLHLKDMKVLFVTAHEGSVPSYAVFTEDGKNVTARSGPLSAQTCASCHTGFQAYCKIGQCGTRK